VHRHVADVGERAVVEGAHQPDRHVAVEREPPAFGLEVEVAAQIVRAALHDAEGEPGDRVRGGDVRVRDRSDGECGHAPQYSETGGRVIQQRAARGVGR